MPKGNLGEVMGAAFRLRLAPQQSRFCERIAIVFFDCKLVTGIDFSGVAIVEASKRYPRSNFCSRIGSAFDEPSWAAKTALLNYFDRSQKFKDSTLFIVEESNALA